MVNDLKDTHHQKPTLPLKTSKSLDNSPDNSTSSINNHTGITSPPLFYTKRTDPITRQTYDYATPIACDNIPCNIIELDPDTDDQDFYILGPEPIKRKPPLMFTPSQINTTIRPNTFIVQDAGIYSNAEPDQFWNRILFSKHPDSTLQLLRKAFSYSFISSNTPGYDTNSYETNPYHVLVYMTNF